MKTMMTSFNNGMGRDDIFFNRLVFFMMKKTGLPIYAGFRMKKNMYMLHTKIGTKIIKGYENLPRLQSIHQALGMVVEAGFIQAVRYECYPNGELAVYWGGRYWAMMPYVPSSPVRYDRFREREEVLALIKRFHQCGDRVSAYVSDLLPRFHLTDHWRQRLNRFEQNREMLLLYLSEEDYRLILEWGNMSLRLFKECRQHSSSCLSILHGDLASHNIIRTQGGLLKLIDFDLMARGMKEYEYVQILQRFLHYTKWSFSSLNAHSFIRNLLEKSRVNGLLLFPSHVMREWNQLCAPPLSAISPKRLQRLVHQTKEEMYYRRLFAREIMNSLNL
jgi:serine/threonine protein kinase